MQGRLQPVSGRSTQSACWRGTRLRGRADTEPTELTSPWQSILEAPAESDALSPKQQRASETCALFIQSFNRLKVQWDLHRQVPEPRLLPTDAEPGAKGATALLAACHRRVSRTTRAVRELGGASWGQLRPEGNQCAVVINELPDCSGPFRWAGITSLHR